MTPRNEPPVTRRRATAAEIDAMLGPSRAGTPEDRQALANARRAKTLMAKGLRFNLGK